MRPTQYLGRKVFLSVLLLSLVSLPFLGCGGGEVASATTFDGTLAANDGSVGTITVTVQSAVAKSFHFSIIRQALAQSSGEVPATGECVFVGDPPVALSGTFTPSTGALNLTGEGTTFMGTANGQGMSGTFSNPSGFSGGFSGLPTTNGNIVNTFCGTFTHAPECPTGDSGTFNIQIDSAGNLSGTTQVTSGNGSPVSLSGTVTGSSFTGTSSPDGGPFSGTISADGQSVSGTFVEICDPGPGTGTGTFSGSTSACQ